MYPIASVNPFAAAQAAQKDKAIATASQKQFAAAQAAQKRRS